jgi:hypothetical protein
MGLQPAGKVRKEQRRLTTIKAQLRAKMAGKETHK